MLPGISGTLLTPTFLERVLIDEFAPARQASRALRPLHEWWRRVERELGPAASVRAMADLAAIPLFDAHGYRVLSLEPCNNGFVGTLARDGAPIAVRIARWGSPADREWRDTVRAGRVAGARWGFVFTGGSLRIVDAQRAWSRRSIEFDLPMALTDERSAMALVALIDAAGRNGGKGALHELVARSEQHGLAVCASLGDGVLAALKALFAALAPARTNTAHERATFEQAVTLVYRLLFLLFAEARAVVPTWHQTYRRAYSVDALCQRALAQPARRGLWKTLQAISRLAHHGCHAGDLVVTPFNGRLFSPRHTPLGERARVPDAVVGHAVVALATTTDGGTRERIAYADLGVEQLGAVYERVLEYEPAAVAGESRLTRTSHDRKSTGSFYTPRAITDFLVRRALHPLVVGKTAEQILRLRVLDPAMGSGAFLVASCRYLAEAVERALVDEGALPREPTREQHRAVRRLVAQRCLFGVDLNPMAVQLARLSLWLASLSADRPLTFLDHHLCTGDSLLGASLVDLTRAPFASRSRRGRETSPPLFAIADARELSSRILPERFRLALEPDDTAAAVNAKERSLAQLTAVGTPLTRWKDAADLWCAAWLWDAGHSERAGRSPLTRGVYHDVLAEVLRGGGTLTQQLHTLVTSHARAMARAHRFFHWELEFPEVFFCADGQRDPGGGFDAVIGNPPWEMLRADTGDRHERAQARQEHRAKLRFFRDARVYRHQGCGHTNRYQLFLERASQLTRPGGRLAVIVPSGFASDQGSSELRHLYFENARIERVFGFDNRARIFPIHRDVRFLLLTAETGATTERLECAFGLFDAHWLDQLPDAAADDPQQARPVQLSRQVLASWDADHLAVPWLTQSRDVEIMSTVTGSVSRLSNASGWHVTFGRELNATDDRRHFDVRGSHASPAALPVIEGKHLEPFRVLTSASTHCISVDRARHLVDASRTFSRARLGYRDVASATNRLTLITARLAPGTVSTHTIFCSKDSLSADAQYCLLALLNSLVANYLVRLRVTTHVTAAVMAQLPVPRPATQSPEFRELATVARSLERTGLAGHDDEYVRLNSLAARLYGLTPAQYEHVLSTFPLLPPDLRTNCLSRYRRFAESQEHGT